MDGTTLAGLRSGGFLRRLGLIVAIGLAVVLSACDGDRPVIGDEALAPPPTPTTEPWLPGCTIDGEVVDTQLTEATCGPLLDLYLATDGDDWNANEGWLTATDPCSWFGVRCDGDFVYIELGSNNLTGTLPSTLGDIPGLAWFSAPSNELSGPIPWELSGSPLLSLLALPDNMLTGSIPQEFGELVNLSVLDLQSNELTGDIPWQLGDLPLTILSLGDNQLTGEIPLMRFHQMQSVTLQNNALEGELPSELLSSEAVHTLWLAGNRFGGPIPPEIFASRNLRSVDLSNNAFTGDLPPVGPDSQITTLNVAFNQLGGSLPDSLVDLPTLEVLTLLGNPCFDDTDAANRARDQFGSDFEIC